MKIVVLGASGMLGSMLVKVLSQKDHVVATVRNLQYITIQPNVEYRLFDAESDDMPADTFEGADMVINAIGAIPQRVTIRAALYNINARFPNRLSYCKTPVIQIATDCIFSGKTGGYIETDYPDTQDYYGQSKSVGELASGIRSLRCSIIGKEPHGCYSLLGWFLSQPIGATINGYTNHRWNGITTLHFAQICQGIIEQKIELPHIQHIVPADSVSKAELLEYFKVYFNRPDIVINLVETPASINRTLETVDPELNKWLWYAAGYEHPPTIEQMVKELAENLKC